MKQRFWFVLLILTLLAAGCSYRQQLLKESEETLAKGDLENAESMLNDLLQYSPRNATGHLYLGFVFLYQDRIEEAVQEFETALQYNDEPDLEYLGLGHAYLALGELERSKEYLNKAREVSEYPATEYLLGFIYLNDGNTEDARKTLKQVSKAYPDRGEIWATLGKLALENLQTLDAVQAYQMAYVYGIRHYDLYVGLAESYYQMGNFRQAVAVTEQALKEDHFTAREKEQLQLKLAQYNVNQNPVKAIESFEEILQKTPNKPEVMLMLGQLYYQQQQYQKAIDLYGEFLKKYPPLAPVLHLLYSCHLELGNDKLAEKYLKDTIQYKPEIQIYYRELINLLHKHKRWNDLIPVYEAALNLAQDDLGLLTNISAVYFELKQYDKAIPYLDRAIALTPENLEIYLTKAQAYFLMRQVNEEQAVYDAILLREPNHLGAITSLAQIYRDAKRWDDALALYQKAQEIAPEDGQFDRHIGVVYLMMEDYTTAQEWLNKALSKEPTDYEAYRYLGDTCYAKDLLQNSVDYYVKSLEIKSDYYGAMYPLAKAYFYLNNLEQAKKYFSAYQKRYPLNEGCKFYLTRIEWLQNQKAPSFKIEPAKP